MSFGPGVPKNKGIVTYEKLLQNHKNMLLNGNYFIDLDTIHKINTRQKTKKNYFHTYARTEWGKKNIQHKALEIWEKLPVELKECSY